MSSFTISRLRFNEGPSMYIEKAAGFCLYFLPK